MGSYVGIETTNSLDLLNAAEYALIKNEMFIRGTGSPIFNNTDLKIEPIGKIVFFKLLN